MVKKNFTLAILLMFVFSLLAPLAPAQAFSLEGRDVDGTTIVETQVEEVVVPEPDTGEGEPQNLEVEPASKGKPKPPKYDEKYRYESGEDTSRMCETGKVSFTKTKVWEKYQYNYHTGKWDLIDSKVIGTEVTGSRPLTEGELTICRGNPPAVPDPEYGDWVGEATCEQQTVSQTRTVTTYWYVELNQAPWWELKSETTTDTEVNVIRMSQAEFEANCPRLEPKVDWIAETSIDYSCVDRVGTYKAHKMVLNVHVVDFGTHFGWEYNDSWTETDVIETKTVKMSKDDVKAHCTVTADEPLFVAAECDDTPSIQYAPTANVSYAQVPVDGQPGFVMVVATAAPGYVLAGQTEFGPYDMNVEPCQPGTKEVTPIGPTFVIFDECGEMPKTNLPEDEKGVNYIISSSASTDEDGNTVVFIVVTAEPEEGYTFAAGAQTRWEQTVVVEVCPPVDIHVTLVTLDCSGLLTFEVGNPDDNIIRDSVEVMVHGFTVEDYSEQFIYNATESVSIVRGQVSYTVKFDTTDWPDGEDVFMRGDVVWSIRGAAISEWINCSDEEPVEPEIIYVCLEYSEDRIVQVSGTFEELFDGGLVDKDEDGNIILVNPHLARFGMCDDNGEEPVDPTPVPTEPPVKPVDPTPVPTDPPVKPTDPTPVPTEEPPVKPVDPAPAPSGDGDGTTKTTPVDGLPDTGVGSGIANSIGQIHAAVAAVAVLGGLGGFIRRYR